MVKGNFYGQGTLEYLVIIAVIIVVGLLVVSLLTNFFDPVKGISHGTGNIKKVTSGQIIIVDGVIDDEGDGLIVLKGLAGQNKEVTRIVVCGNDINYTAKTLVNNEIFGLNIDNSVCPCTNPGEFIEANVIIYYNTRNLTTQQETKTVILKCADDINNETSDVTQPEADTTNPTVLLLSPINNDVNTSNTVTFSYSASDNNAIASCSLLFDGSVIDTDTTITATDYFTGINLEAYQDENHSWDVQCTDYASNTATSTNGAFNMKLDANAYEINNCLQLQDMNLDLTGNYFLMEDINCYSDTHSGGTLYNGGLGFKPVGTSSSKFTGNLDGNNYIISELNINRPTTNRIGLFGNLENATIQDIYLTNVDINGKWAVSGLVGYNYGGSTITNCGVSGTIDGNEDIGGIMGVSMATSTIDNCYFNGNLSGNYSAVGGIIGWVAASTTIKNSYSIGTITGSTSVGGLVGTFWTNSNLFSSYSSSTVSGEEFVGGLIGQDYNYTTIYNSYATGDLSTPDGNYIGALVGNAYSDTNIYNSYATGDINGNNYIGGLIGSTSNDAYVSQTYAKGLVTGTSYDNGLVGYATSTTIADSYWDYNRTAQANCFNDSNSGCLPKNIDNNEPNYWYYDGNAPIASWGTWANVSGDEWATSDGNWSICRGTTDPWLTWENRTC